MRRHSPHAAGKRGCRRGGALLAAAALCAIGLAAGAASAVHAQTSPLREKLEGAVPAKPLLVPYKVEERKPDRSPEFARNVTTLTCPPSTSEGGSSKWFPGWSFEVQRVRYVGIELIDPQQISDGAVIQCLYGFDPKTRDAPAHFMTLRQPLGPGASAQTCRVSGYSVSCGAGAAVTCPRGRAEEGRSRTWSDWLFVTPQPDLFVGAVILNPPTPSAGAVVECRYGSEAIAASLRVKLWRSLGQGIEKRRCRTEPAQGSVTCVRPL